jgi:hypothetical protein
MTGRVTHHVIRRRLLNLGCDITELDCRYLDRWIRQYPKAFPQYMIDRNFITELCPNTGNWVHVQGNTFTKAEFKWVT